MLTYDQVSVLMTLERLCGQATLSALKRHRGERRWDKTTVDSALPELVQKNLLHRFGDVYAFTHAGMRVVCAVKETSAEQVELTTTPKVDRRDSGELDLPGQDQVPQSGLDIRPARDTAGLVPQLYTDSVERPRLPVS